MEQKEDRVHLVKEAPQAKLEHQVHQEHQVYLVKMYASTANICLYSLMCQILG